MDTNLSDHQMGLILELKAVVERYRAAKMKEWILVSTVLGFGQCLGMNTDDPTLNELDDDLLTMHIDAIADHVRTFAERLS